jgi:hypothetical protein
LRKLSLICLLQQTDLEDYHISRQSINNQTSQQQQAHLSKQQTH